MKLGKRFGIIAAMEELEDSLTPPVEDPIVDETESADSAIIESNELATEIEDGDVAVDDVVEATDDLTAIADTVEEAGEMDETSAAIAEVAVESLYRRLGITRRKALPVAMEAFGSTSNRKKSTKLAIEDWREAAKGAIEVVKKFFQELWEKMKTFFKGLFDVALRLKTRAESIKKAVEKAGDRKDAEKISAGQWVNNILNDKGGIGDVASDVASLSDVITTITQNTNGIVEFSGHIEAGLAKPTSKEMKAVVSSSINKLVQAGSVLKEFGAVSGIKAPEGMKALAFNKTIVGNKKLVVIVPEKLISAQSETFEQDIASLNKVSCNFIDGPAAKQDLSKVDPLELKAIEAVCNSVIKTLSAVEDSESIVNSLEGMIKAFGKDITATDDEAKSAIKMATSGLRAGGKLCTTPVFAIDRHAINVCKSALDYCNASLKAYGGAAPESSPAPAAA